MAKSKKTVRKPAAKKPIKKPAKSARPAKKVVAKKAAAKKVTAKKAVKAKQPTIAPKKFVAPAKPSKPIDVSKFVTPLDDRILVQTADAEKMTSGGLHIPDTATSKSANLKGQVLAVGRGHRDKKGRVRPMDVQKGDQVIFSEYSGSKIRYQDQDLIIIRETDVLGILS